MKIMKKIIQVGDSKGIIIDRVFCDSLNLFLGDKIEIDIKKVE